MDDSVRLAERLQILLAHAQGILARAANVKQHFEKDDNKPRIFLDPNLQPLFKAIVKRFPNNDGLSQIQGYDRFTSLHRDIMEASSEPYALLGLTAEFREASQAVFLDVSRLSVLSNEINNDLLENFARLASLAVRVHMTVGMIEDRRLLALCYSRTFAIAHGTSEASYKRVADYLTDYELPVAQVQSEFSSFSTRLGEALVFLKASLDSNAVPVSQLRNEGVHNMIQVPSNVKKPSGEDRRLRDLRRYNEVSETILFCLLACPGEMSKQHAIDSLRLIFERGLVWNLCRGEHHAFTSEFEALAIRSSIRNAKNILYEASATAASLAWMVHRERRDYCRQSMTQTLHLLRDKPGLACPKLSLILSLIGMARDEVIWYFMHIDQQEKGKKAKAREEDLRESAITEIIFLIEEIKSMVLEQKAAIAKYYGEYLAGYYRNKLYAIMGEPLASVSDNAVLHSQFELAIDLLGQAGTDPTVNFEPLRLNWQRSQAFLSLPSASGTVHAFGPISALMDEICARTFYVDKLEERLTSIAGLHELLYHQAAVLSTIEHVIKTTAVQAKYVKAFLTVFSKFADNAPATYQRERPLIAAKTAALMERIYFDIAQRVAQLAHDIAVNNVRYNVAGAPEAARSIYEKLTKERGSKEAAAQKAAAGNENRPGAESNLRMDKDGKALFTNRHSLKNLCLVFRDMSNVTIHETTFYPKMFLIEAIIMHTRIFFSNLVRAAPTSEDSLQPIRRPTAILADLQSYINSFLSLEPYARIDLPVLMRHMILEHTDMHKARKLAGQLPGGDLRRGFGRGKSLSLVQAHAFADEAPFMAILTLWYVDAAINRLYNQNALYTPVRQTFLPRVTTTPGRFDRFMDPNEIRALVTLVGPNGVRHMEERIIRVVASWVGDLKDLISRNREPLEHLLDPSSSPSRSSDALKRVKNTEDVIDRMLSIGYALQFRDMITSTLRSVLSSAAPDLLTAVLNAHAQYPPNIFGLSGYLEVDILANAVGVYGKVDVGLRGAVDVHCRDAGSDAKLWSLLPVLVACTLPVLAGAEATAFNPNLRSHDNNAALIARGLSQIITATLTATPEHDKAVLVAAHRAFVEVGGYLLQRMSAEQQRPREIDAAFLVVQEFVECSPFVPSDVAEGSVAYGLIRSTQSDLLRLRAKKRIPLKEEQAES